METIKELIQHDAHLTGDCDDERCTITLPVATVVVVGGKRVSVEKVSHMTNEDTIVVLARDLNGGDGYDRYDWDKLSKSARNKIINVYLGFD